MVAGLYVPMFIVRYDWHEKKHKAKKGKKVKREEGVEEETGIKVFMCTLTEN